MTLFRLPVKLLSSKLPLLHLPQPHAITLSSQRAPDITTPYLGLLDDIPGVSILTLGIQSTNLLPYPSSTVSFMTFFISWKTVEILTELSQERFFCKWWQLYRFQKLYSFASKKVYLTRADLYSRPYNSPCCPHELCWKLLWINLTQILPVSVLTSIHPNFSFWTNL